MGKMRSWGSVMNPNPISTNGFAVRVKELFNTFHDAMIGVGLTQTTDTGQLSSFDSVTIVEKVALTNFGYRIYEINDSLHTNSPIFIKITFFSISGSQYINMAQVPRLDIQIGSGSDGNGNLINASTTQSTFPYSSSDTTGANGYNDGVFSSYVYLDDGIFWAALACGSVSLNQTAESIHPTFAGSGAPVAFFAISRPCNSAGTILKDKAALIIASRFNVSSSRFVLSKTTPVCIYLNLLTGYKLGSNYPLSRPLSDQSLTIGGSMPVYRLYGYFGDGQLSQLSGVASASALQVSDGDIANITLEGIKARSYIIPSRSIRGFENIPNAQDPRNFIGSLTFDTPVMAWGGQAV